MTEKLEREREMAVNSAGVKRPLLGAMRASPAARSEAAHSHPPLRLRPFFANAKVLSARDGTPLSSIFSPRTR